MGIVHRTKKNHINFDVTFNIAHYNEEGLVYSTDPRKAEFLMDDETIYIGSEESWYKVDVRDIRDMVSWSDVRTLELIFEEFKISLHTLEYPRLSALRHLLTIMQAKNQ